MPAVFKAPDETKRTLILGRTGAGKTVGGMDILSGQNWHKQPWVIIDYKKDELIQDLIDLSKGRVKIIDINDKPPKKAGLYVVRPLMDEDDEALEVFLKRCWAQGHIGIYADEGYMIPRNSRAMKAILTQGRALRVPVIILYQRPSWLNPYVIAQADYFMAYDQTNIVDQKTTAGFVAPAVSPDGRRITVYDTLPEHYRLWHDVSQAHTFVLTPAPHPDQVLAKFRERLNPPKSYRGVI